ncbi:hypothetical protein GWO43_03755 [candidate division KSB1 bacterium]|nr:hypothetical protein [candidate division KSB1 bacterium]NIR70667.1 hypothetical protein [candidate division KSB1 bacterium]NIS23155.1 hypothetical protein [candidate division KSB1 bacterium]NIT70016.1 hypothetical protein [candidate division KSB1 bacterium]NIU23653.1 hypothetical protein [candidate division KSB1 bacterium]
MSKKAITFILCAFLISVQFGLANAQGLKKQTRTKVTFGFGTYLAEEVVKMTGDVKRTESDAEFKGKGLTGKLAGKFFAKSGETAEVLNLAEEKVYQVDTKDKKCRVRPIVKMSDSVEVAMNRAKEAMQSWQQEREKYSELQDSSQIEIIETVFRVQNMDESKKVNGFDSEKFWIDAYTRWQNKQTGQTGTDSMSIIARMTPLSDDIQQAQQIEMDFNQKYMEKLGVDVQLNEMKESLLGGKWFDMLQQVQGGSAAVPDYEDVGDEMKQLEGYYPIVIDGKYYPVRSTPKSGEMSEGQEEEGVKDMSDVQGKLGGLAKGLFGKKKKDKKEDKLEPAFSFYSETRKLELTNITASDLLPAYDCEEMK